jgi:hypothetical protein
MGKYAIDYNSLKPGTIIVYLLRPDQFPTHPYKEWRGRVRRVYMAHKAVLVDVLNAGFDCDQEPVYINQILRIEHEANSEQGEVLG